MQETQNSNHKRQNNDQQINAKFQNKNRPYDLRERLLVFTRRILLICRMLQKNQECENIRKQLSRAASSIGANFEEADGSVTKKDFICKASISRKEAKETRYWLRVISGVFVKEELLIGDIQEIDEIISILSAILIKVGAKSKR